MTLEYLSAEEVEKLLDWDGIILTVENALIDVSKGDGSVIVPPRLSMPFPNQGRLFTMPGFSNPDNSLGCKIVSTCRKNNELGIPSIFATILLLDTQTGKPKVVVEGTKITGWRTAAVSAAATKYMHKGEKYILAIFGAGVQAETHALALNHLFNFSEIRIWNRTKENAVKLSKKLPFPVKLFDSIEDCCKNADVICTTTYANEPFLKMAWLKPSVHINAVGCGHYTELEEEIYQNAYITVEHTESARKEITGLLEKGIEIRCEIGEFITKGYEVPLNKCSVFQSLGLAIEDVTVANYVYKKYARTKEEPLGRV